MSPSNTEAPDSALTQIECWTPPGAELAPKLHFTSFLSLPQCIFECILLPCVPTDSCCNCPSVVLVIQTKGFPMIYLHSLFARITIQTHFLHHCVVGVSSTGCMFVVCHHVHACVCLSVFQWAWRVCCLTHLSALSCPYLYSLSSRPQSAPLCCSGLKSAAVHRQAVPHTQALFFKLCAVAERK